MKEIKFFAPGLKYYETEELKQNKRNNFIPISLTGSECSLMCDHCKGKILTSMRALRSGENLFELCKRLNESGTEGVLISGGSDKNGVVPLVKYKDDIREIKRRINLNILVHTGIVDEKLALALKESNIDGAMIDIIGSDETIRRVYHMNKSVDDFEKSLCLLTEYGIPAIPHIVLGLHYGRFWGEYKALDIVSNYPIKLLVIVIITPYFGTPMEDIKTPEINEIERFFYKAKAKNLRVVLGCARPAGNQKFIIDKLAVDMEFDGIAYPSNGILNYSVKKGFNPEFREVCCSL
jgi:hypothetical protein